MSKYEKIKIFLLGVLVAFSTIFLTGITSCANNSGNGRYQLCLGRTYMYFLDTTTGEFWRGWYNEYAKNPRYDLKYLGRIPSRETK